MKHGWTRYIYQLWFNFLHKITWTSQRIPRQLNDTHPKIHLEFLCPKRTCPFFLGTKRTCPLLCQFLNFLPISYLIDILHPESPASWYKLNWTKALRSTDESNSISEPQSENHARTSCNYCGKQPSRTGVLRPVTPPTSQRGYEAD